MAFSHGALEACRDNPAKQGAGIIGYDPWGSHLSNYLAVRLAVSGYDPFDTLVGSDKAASQSGWLSSTFESCRDDS